MRPLDWFVLIFLTLGFLSGGLLYGLLVSRLRRIHPETWVALGRPRVLLALSVSTGPAMTDFIWKGGHGEVADAGVLRLVRGLQIVTVANLALFVASVWLVSVARP